jgi:hypothetical protein
VLYVWVRLRVKVRVALGSNMRVICLNMCNDQYSVSYRNICDIVEYYTDCVYSIRQRTRLHLFTLKVRVG